MTATAGKSLAFGRVGNCFLYAGSKNIAPKEEDWEKYLQFLEDALRRLGPDKKVNTLVLEQGTGPSAAQRKKLMDLTSPYIARIAVITASPIGRGVVTALAWFKPGYKAFNITEQESAYEWLEIPSALMPEVRRTMATLEREVL